MNKRSKLASAAKASSGPRNSIGIKGIYVFEGTTAIEAAPTRGALGQYGSEGFCAYEEAGLSRAQPTVDIEVVDHEEVFLGVAGNRGGL